MQSIVDTFNSACFASMFVHGREHDWLFVNHAYITGGESTRYEYEVFILEKKGGIA